MEVTKAPRRNQNIAIMGNTAQRNATGALVNIESARDRKQLRY